MNRKYLDKVFKEHNIDAIVSEAPQTRLWLTGIPTTDGYVIIEKNEAHLFVDGRYIEFARNNAKNVNVHLLVGSSLKDFFAEKKYNKVAFEEDYLNLQTHKYLQSLINPTEEVFIRGQELRILKSNEEIEIMQKSIDISLEALNELYKWIKPGMTEKEVAAKLNYLMKLKGAEKESFDEIVATGSSSAEPHHHPTDRKLVAGDLLKIDFGALYKGYSADITRTIIMPDENGKVNINNPKAKEILDIVLAAAKAGRDAVKPGIKASTIDQICRDYINNAGYGEYFVHGTGHGLGIDVHELPYVSSKGYDYTLEPGMVITVEPGIYIEGLGGARNEDDVLVTETGRYVFSKPEERS
ncbi:aminopeptidase P family protein [Mycoplasma sp. ES3157-GEN-MYC]|uniref:Aminopeptidase P family protein n=1 Tax=Mycoplasma miroungigenitalium TaxID=754515 RepID=A0A6M4JFG5_9MOLU|nr:aminopeptidase P family protein [Mycoplasma miroungigenitalium]MBU4690349.1 aminopeptidase P family protein [Mycoplasma miroungigenitalium]MBU4691616.1 aminopeptidase P family protein [Mycoplasma miroungigenitalium]QJR43441.1 aminopeptidase P family protein [Mycoplasma miroungigenitalium]